MLKGERIERYTEVLEERHELRKNQLYCQLYKLCLTDDERGQASEPRANCADNLVQTHFRLYMHTRFR